MRILAILLLAFSISASENEDIFIANGECSFNKPELEDEAREKAIQRAISLMALHRSANVTTSATDVTSVAEENEESNVTSQYSRTSNVATEVNVKNTWVHKSQVIVGTPSHYKIELAIKLDDLFPERKISRAVQNNNKNDLKALIMEYEINGNKQFASIAWDGLYQMDRENPNTQNDFITYLYRNECYERVVITASLHGITDSNLMVRMSAKKLHERNQK